jgi:predicted transcriptional regulator
MIFPNLKAELARRGWTVKTLSEVTKIPLSTLNARLYGKSDLRWKDANKIKEALSTDLPLEVLFAEREAA